MSDDEHERSDTTTEERETLGRRRFLRTGLDYSVAVLGLLGGGATLGAAGCSNPGGSSSGRCTNTCEYADDGDCDDGGSGSDYSLCELGTDCADCGPRSGSYSDVYADAYYANYSNSYSNYSNSYSNYTNYGDYADYSDYYIPYSNYTNFAPPD